MFFLIRSVFWLSIVFSSMAWTVDASQPPQPHALRDAVVQGGLEIASAAKDAAVSQVRAWCVKSADQCISDAAQLTALIVANQSDDTPEDAGALSALRATYPLPHTDPRRHILPKAATTPRG
ncbi:hypothetical protein [Beijerinckia sp. L45]|uniref:hypothetical protein n=1 Tax=Beijerinckia sp. L45 TaxID=1641855 RepID=UPI00131C1B38|nr:hypothetical protein [Beijerinckia sp. L45]